MRNQNKKQLDIITLRHLINQKHLYLNQRILYRIIFQQMCNRMEKSTRKSFYQVLNYFLQQKIYSLSIIEMRNKTRLLSSLMDLKLRGSQRKITGFEQEGRRKNEKYCPIKVSTNEDIIYENFTRVEKKKSIVDRTLILKSLGGHFIFSSLIKDKTMQEYLVEKFRLCRVNSGEYLMKQSDNASSFFILHEGELMVQIDGDAKRKIEAGQGFGELALLYSSPRSASIKANKTSFLWFIDRATFRQTISMITQKNFHQTRSFIEKNPFFLYLTSIQKDQIASIATAQHFVKSTKICKQGEQAMSMFIVKNGNLLKSKNSDDKKNAKQFFKSGDFFGEYTIIQKNSKWKETIIAQQDSDVIAIGVEDIERVLGKSLPSIVIRNKARQLLLKNKETSKLSGHFIDMILDCFKIKQVKSGEEFGAHQNSSIFFFVLQGKYTALEQLNGIQKGETVESLTQKGNFISGSLAQPQKHESKPQIRFESDGKVVWAYGKQILKYMDCTFQQAIQKCEDLLKSKKNHRNHVQEIRNRCSQYSIKDYKVLTKLGQGQFGTVFLVTDPTKANLYALKCISKQQTTKNKLEKHLVNEKLVLEEMNEQSPFCVNYIRSYKDENYVYFLMEYINGMELFDAIRVIGILTPDQTRFYGSIMISFLQQMHEKGIIYRDLKPENVMVEENGYIKLIDMGTCKKMNQNGQNKCSALGKTFTIIGTPNYMAPQIISGKGYSFTVDLWSLGVVLYEFMSGYVPFGEEAEDPYEIYQQILKKPLQYPNYMKCAVSNSFITQLLSKTPESRICGSYNSLKRHPFLAKVDWGALLDKKVEPAFIVPKNKLIQVNKYMEKLKNLSSQLATVKSSAVKKITPWDQSF